LRAIKALIRDDLNNSTKVCFNYFFTATIYVFILSRSNLNRSFAHFNADNHHTKSTHNNYNVSIHSWGAALNERILNHMYANEIENGESLNALEILAFMFCFKFQFAKNPQQHMPANELWDGMCHYIA
jgi:uncharacterized protein (DUF486 family)